jgi:hypothetical protein
MDKFSFFKNKRDLVFGAIGIFLILAIVVFVVYLVKFLASNFESALGPGSLEAKPETGFNLEGLKKLGIIK